MDDYGELLNKLRDSYGKDFDNVQQVEEIKAYLKERQIPLSSLNALHRRIIETETFLPRRRKDWKRILDQIFLTPRESLSEARKNKLPYYQLERVKDWTADEILDNCRRIRNRQAKIWESGLLSNNLESQYISFLSIWDRLNDVDEDFREIAKKRIIENGERELYSTTKVDLSDLGKKIKPANVKKIYKKNPVREIPF
jgi:hypothetical protein